MAPCSRPEEDGAAREEKRFGRRRAREPGAGRRGDLGAARGHQIGGRHKQRARLGALARLGLGKDEDER